MKLNEIRLVTVPTKELKRKVGLPKSTVWDAYDEAVMQELGAVEKVDVHKVLPTFKKFMDKLSNFAYWYLLGVCWVRMRELNYQAEFGELFLSERIERVNSVMKPKEKKVFMQLMTKMKVELYWVDKPGANIRFFLNAEDAQATCERLKGKGVVKGVLEDRTQIRAYFERLGTKEVVVPKPCVEELN